MQITYLSIDRQLDNFLCKQKNASLLQSWYWGEVQKVEGRKIWRIGLEENDELIAVLTVIKHNLPFGRSYLYSPRGPVFKLTTDDALYARGRTMFLAEIKKKAQTEKSIFWRIEPIKNNFLKGLNNFKIYKTKRVQPLEELVVPLRKKNQLSNLSLSDQASRTDDQIILDRQDPAVAGVGHKMTNFGQPAHKVSLCSPAIRQRRLDSEIFQFPNQEQYGKNLAELLKSMKSKTRYNIRLAKKKGVKCQWIDLKQPRMRQKNLDIFWQIIQETSHRNKFGLHPKDHYQKILKILGEKNLAGLIVAEYKQQIIAANLITFFGDTAYYLHGGSRYQYRNLMAPYLLHWQVILEAYQRGIKYYNLSGVAVHFDNIKTLGGITKFKLGFGSQIISYPGAFEIVLDPFWYRIYRLYKRIKK